MTLYKYFEKSGSLFFQYRSYIPIAFFIISIPAMLLMPQNNIFKNSTLTIISVAVSCFGEFLRAYTVATTPKGTSGRNTKSQCAESLNTNGIYSVVRHPLYFANFMMWLGVTCFTANWLLIVVVPLLFFIYYERIMFAEEQFLYAKFKQDFVSWANITPAFIPNFRRYKKSNVKFSIKSVIRREYSSIMSLALSFMFVDTLKYFAVYKKITCNRLSVFIAAFTVLCALTLHFVRHYSNLLNEKERS